MNLVVIDGTVIKEIVDYKVDIEPLGEWERNAQGVLVGDLIAYKTKLSLTVGLIDGNTYKTILAAAKGNFFLTVQYFDPRINGINTGTFYSSPRTGTMVLIDKSDIIHWKDVAFNLIER